MSDEIKEKDDVSVPEVAEEQAGQSDAPNDIPEVEPAKKPNPLKRLCGRYLDHKKIAIPVTIVVSVLCVLAVPVSRMVTLGLFMKRVVVVQVNDSLTGKPVSGADVTLRGVSAQTGADGKASVKVKLGKGSLQVAKKYYKDGTSSVVVDVGKPKQDVVVALEATGRQVTVKVSNKIANAPLADVTIRALDTDAKTDKEGKATLVLPADKAEVEATLSKDGFNELKTKIIVTDKEDAKNIFAVVPAGKLYFLSKLSGKVDVVKTDLDGGNRQTVLAGTGKESDTETVMLASRDWKYLALKSRRDSATLAKLYLIETANDKLTTIDEGDAEFTLNGWTGSNFVFQVRRNNYQPWQPKATAIKSYSAPNKKLTTLDETAATGDQYNYGQEQIGWLLSIGTKQIAYFKYWSAYHNNYSASFPELSGKGSQLITIDLDKGTEKKTVKTYAYSIDAPSATTYYAPKSSYTSALYEPNEIYFITTDSAGQQAYAELENDVVVENSKEAKQFFDTGKAYPTFLYSPSAQNTFWSDARDGKNALFIGDTNGANGKQVAALSEYLPYGWFSDEYILVSKKSSELYILPVAGGDPVKISDYHKPAYTYNGYGGGYGGL
jgi:hypothetical protein